MQNIRSKINGPNTEILKPKPAQPQKLCNCLVKEDCQLNGLCLTSSILYQATVKCSDSKYKLKRYKGICEMTFKKRYANHKKSFKGQYKVYNPTLKKCNLCLNEKLAIIDVPDKNLLNKRFEVISQCHHQKKFKLVNLMSRKTPNDVI